MSGLGNRAGWDSREPVLAPRPEKTSWFGERNLVHVVGTGPERHEEMILVRHSRTNS